MASKTHPGFGSDSLVPRMTAAAMSAKGIGAEEGFVLSRVDGRSTVAQICLLVPFAPERTVQILAALARAGAVEIPGSEIAAEPRERVPTPPPANVPTSPPNARERVPTPPPANVRERVPTPPANVRERVPTPPAIDAQPHAAAANAPQPSPALVDGLDLSVEQARRIDDFFRSLEQRDAFELLEVARNAEKKDIKRAYFKMSKEFHPDRFFNKNIGPYKERLSKIFQSIKAAFELLSDDERRASYEQSGK